MRLSPTYEAEYAALIEDLGSHCAELPERICLHWPMAEPTYEGRFMAIGQALNGWMVDEAACQLWRPEVRRAKVAATRATSESPTAWSWMWPQPWGRPFWRLVRSAMAAVGVELNEIAWSNLAKAAPAAGKNPWGALLERQHRLGGRLLRREVNELDPDVVLLVSGRGYAGPFLAGAGFDVAWRPEGALQFDGQLDGRRWVIVNHPGTFARRYEQSLEAVQRALGAGHDD